MFSLIGLILLGSQDVRGVRPPLQRPKFEMEHEEYNMPPALRREVRDQPHRSSFPRPLAGANLVIHQVNVDNNGMNILGDAANEPSIAVDPNNPNHMAIGWRQFDSITSDFRQAGHAYSLDGGNTWVNNGPFTPGTFRSDPILAAGLDGVFHYDSLTTLTANDMWNSGDSGSTWNGPNYAFGGDKTWMVCDRNPASHGLGAIYASWSSYYGSAGQNICCRSLDGGLSFQYPSLVPGSPTFGSIAVESKGGIYVVGTRPNDPGLCWAHASQPWFNVTRMQFETGGVITTAYDIGPSSVINPAGLCGQVWVGVGPVGTTYSGHVYVVATVGNLQGQPDSIALLRSTDSGSTWSAPIRIDTNLGASTHAYHWFGTLSVAPNGRLDVVYNDTGLDSNQTQPTTCVTMYRSSTNDGATWSAPVQLTQPWAFGVGYPQQNKIGDYYHLISDNTGAHLAFAATFNGEQDVWYMRIPAQ